MRHFDAPEAVETRFYEVRAKSILNHVPPASQMPFRWTLNPYRGCTHGCQYCLHGETPILMADGRHKPISDLDVGEEIFGTDPTGFRYRRYVRTAVLDKWITVKPAYRVTLEGGTDLIVSGDHRLLSNRGWKHVVNSARGQPDRPHLTTRNRLVGTAAFEPQPEHDADYRRGYLCGIVRGDGTLRSYACQRASGGRYTGYRFRLALTDLEALRRARDFLSLADVEAGERVFQRAAGSHREVVAITAQSAGSFERIGDLIEWPVLPSLRWCRGFLAGIFDAEGCRSDYALRIANTDSQILAWTEACARRLGFDVGIDHTNNANGLKYVRIRGGLSEHLRFFHLTDPAITRKRDIEGQMVKTFANLRVAEIEPLGRVMPLYDITTGTGDFIANGVVSHNCFARNTHTYLDLDAGHDFDSKIVVKVNAPELVRKELAAPKWAGEHIAMGTNVDVYQRAEGRYRLMPGILQALLDSRNPYSILTKGTLILRDLDLLAASAEVTDVGLSVSVGCTDEDLWRTLEPGTPSPLRRLGVCATLSGHGLRCGVLMGPVVPFLSDSPAQLEATVRQVAGAGATHVSPIVLHLRPGARDWFLAWLARHHPALVPRYRGLYGSRAYAPRDYQERIAGQVRELAERYRVGRGSPPPIRRWRGPAAAPPPAPAAEQLTLL